MGTPLNGAYGISSRRTSWFERLEFLPRMPHQDFLAVHRRVDIALDTFPYHDTTTCFSLWMGVPPVVLAGATTSHAWG